MILNMKKNPHAGQCGSRHGEWMMFLFLVTKYQGLHKNSRTAHKPFTERLDLPFVQLTFPVENF